MQIELNLVVAWLVNHPIRAISVQHFHTRMGFLSHVTCTCNGQPDERQQFVCFLVPRKCRALTLKFFSRLNSNARHVELVSSNPLTVNF